MIATWTVPEGRRERCGNNGLSSRLASLASPLVRGGLSAGDRKGRPYKQDEPPYVSLAGDAVLVGAIHESPAPATPSPRLFAGRPRRNGAFDDFAKKEEGGRGLFSLFPRLDTIRRNLLLLIHPMGGRASAMDNILIRLCRRRGCSAAVHLRRPTTPPDLHTPAVRPTVS